MSVSATPRPARPAATAARAAPAAWARDDRGLMPLTLLAWTLIVLMIVPDNFNYASLSGTAPESGGLVSRLAWLGLLAGAVVALATRARLAALTLRYLNPFLSLFVVLALFSIAWSLEPGVTARRCIRVLTIFLVALAVVQYGWHRHRFQELLRPVISFMLCGSLVFGLLSPELAIHQESSAELEGAWRGLANHKNTLGVLSCLGLILWVHAFFNGPGAAGRSLAGIILALTCLLLSRSSTSLMTAFFAVAFLVLSQKAPVGLRPYLPFAVAMFFCLLLLYALAVLRLIPGSELLLKPIMVATGKDPSFTGRSEIWNLMLEHIGTQPVLGNGLGAYWTGIDPGTASYEFIRQMNFYPGSAHSGYLEVLNDLGTVGLLCLLGFILHYLRQGIRLARLDAPAANLCIALFLQQAVTNLSESHWFNVLSIGFVVMTFAAAGMARQLLELDLRRMFAARARQAAPAPMVKAHA